MKPYQWFPVGVVASIATFIGGLEMSSAHAETRNVDTSGQQAALMAIVEGDGELPELAGAALHVVKNGQTVFSSAAGCAHFADGRCEREMKSSTTLRVASVSKVAVALAISDLQGKDGVDFDTDISVYLGRNFRHPDHPQTPITIRHLLSHTSSIRDPEEYWVVAPGSFADLLEVSSVFENEKNHAPGEYFSYANLNYGLLAEIVERTSNMRFDEYVEQFVVQPLAFDAGFNWSGVDQEVRAEAATLYRMEDGSWSAQIDDGDMLRQNTPVFLQEEGLDADQYLADYSIGTNPTLFSPQGGLRASVSDIATLISTAADTEQLAKPVWSLNNNKDNGDHSKEMYSQFGAGLHIINAHPELGNRALIGHSGEAYGLYSGAWVVKSEKGNEDTVIAFAINGVDGTPVRSNHSSFYQSELALMKLALDIAGVSDHNPTPHDDEEHTSPEARPFDKKADATLEVGAALRSASYSGKPALLVLGANWCHDSRGFAGKVAEEPLKSFVADNFHLVYVDVGQRDRNLSIANQFGVSKLIGTPTILIVSGEGTLLNESSVHDWRTAYSRSTSELENYLRKFTSDASNVNGK